MLSLQFIKIQNKMIGSIINAAAVVFGGGIGLFLGQRMPERFKTIYFQAIGLFTFAIGISMVWNMKDIFPIVVSIALGALLGEWMKLEQRTEQLAEVLKSKLKLKNQAFSEGLTTSFLLFCVGSMTILGAIQEGTTGSAELLLTKSLMDGFSAILLASAFGISVIISALPLFVFQAGLTLLAAQLSPMLTPDIIQAISNTGGVLLIGLAINILEIKKLRIINMLPALIIVVVLLVIWP